MTTFWHATDEPPSTHPTLLLDCDDSPVNNTVVVTRAAPTYSPGTRDLVATSQVPHALPAMPAPHPFRRPVRVPGRAGLYVCGDHRDTSSIQGALVSGRRAADVVLADRGRPAPEDA